MGEGCLEGLMHQKICPRQTSISDYVSLSTNCSCTEILVHRCFNQSALGCRYIAGYGPQKRYIMFSYSTRACVTTYIIYRPVRASDWWISAYWKRINFTLCRNKRRTEATLNSKKSNGAISSLAITLPHLYFWWLTDTKPRSGYDVIGPPLIASCTDRGSLHQHVISGPLLNITFTWLHLLQRSLWFIDNLIGKWKTSSKKGEMTFLPHCILLMEPCTCRCFHASKISAQGLFVFLPDIIQLIGGLWTRSI